MLRFAFTVEQACRLTGLSRRQLGYWARTDFFTPEDEDHGKLALYSFRDLVGLRVLGILRTDHKVPLQELRKVGAWLRRYHHTPWSGLRLYILGRKIFFDEPTTGMRLQARGKPEGQGIMPQVLQLEAVASDVNARVQSLRRRTREQQGQIERGKNIARNHWRVAGTRIPTEATWSFHRAGSTVEQIIAEYPDLTAEDVRAAIEHEEKRGRMKKTA